MTHYQVDFSYNIPEWGSVTLEASDVEEAEELAIEYVEELYDHVEDIEIEGVKEIVQKGR